MPNKLALFDTAGTMMKGSRLKDEIAFPAATERTYRIKADIDVINRHDRPANNNRGPKETWARREEDTAKAK